MTDRIALHPTATAAPRPERRHPSERDVFVAALRAQQAIIDEQAATHEAWIVEHEQGRRAAEPIDGRG